MPEPLSPSSEHRCGPSPAQTMDAVMRGEVMGTWPRCAECQSKEDELIERLGPHLIERRPDFISLEVPRA